MGKMCAVVDCSKSTVDGVTLFRLPNSALRPRWMLFIRNVNAKYSKWKEIKSMYLCSDHFDVSFILKGYTGTTNVAKNGFPSLLNGELVPVPKFEISVEQSNTDYSYVGEPSPQLSFEVEESNVVSLSGLSSLPNEIFNTHTISSQINVEVETKEQKIRRLEKELEERDRIVESKTKELSHYKNLLRVKSQTCKRLYESRSKLEAEIVECKRKKLNEEPEVPNKILCELNEREKTCKTTPYSDELRLFSYSLHYYSARAYGFARESIPTLPSISSLQKWSSHVTVSPGFLQTSLAYIKSRTEESEDPLYFALSIDEMHIRKQLLHRGNGFVGFSDYGNLAPLPGVGQVASTASFIMATLINGNKKIPIAYALTSGLKADKLAEMIKSSLTIMAEIKARVLSITFDGLPSNLRAVQLLGANLDVKCKNIQPYIINPVTLHKVYVILDPSHMLKLLRNVFKDYSVLLNESGREIKWSHITKLHELQSETGLKAANKLSARHVNFNNQKMKTKLCVQVLSNSVSVALGVCRELQLEGFDDTGPTEEFLLYCDRIFDMLNSRTMGKGFKAAFWPSNINERMEFFSKCRSYLLGIKRLDGVRLIDTPRGVGIKGLLISFKSIELICKDVILNDTEFLKYLPMFKLSQDMIETFFGLIRSRGGYNNNPNVVQLESAIRACLCMRTQSVKSGNCVEQEQMCTKVSALSRLKTIMDDTAEPLYEENHDIEDVDLQDLSIFISNVVVYIAGWVAKRLCKKLTCPKCIVSLHLNDNDMPKLMAELTLLRFRNMGGLFAPSYDTVLVSKITEQYIRQFQLSGIHTLDKKRIVSLVVKECVEKGIEFKCEGDSSGSCSHSPSLIQAISFDYISVRFHYMAKHSSLVLNPITNRNYNNKFTLFAGN